MQTAPAAKTLRMFGYLLTGRGLYMSRGEINPWVKGSVCFILKCSFPPFSPPVVQVSKQNRHRTFDPRINFTPV